MQVIPDSLALHVPAVIIIDAIRTAKDCRKTDIAEPHSNIPALDTVTGRSASRLLPAARTEAGIFFQGVTIYEISENPRSNYRKSCVSGLIVLDMRFEGQEE